MSSTLQKVVGSVLMILYVVVVVLVWVSTAALKLYVLAQRARGKSVLPWRMNYISLSELDYYTEDNSPTINNGHIIHVLPYNQKFVFQESFNDKETLDNLQRMLWELKDLLEPSHCNSKHSAHRLHIFIAPGEDAEEHGSCCPFCYRNYTEEGESCDK